MPSPRPLSVPTEEYSQSGEMLFRREVEDFLLELSAHISGIDSGASTGLSNTRRRAILLNVPLGQVVVG